MNQSSACAGLQWPTSPRLSQPCSAVTPRTCRCRWSRGGGSHRDVHQEVSAKYEKAVTCLAKDQDAPLTFYDCPAGHWDHLRTSNPTESVFATGPSARRARSQDTARLMVFKLVMAAAKTWHRLKGENQPPKVVQGVIRERRRGHRHASTKRRLITPSPKFKHRSLCGSARHTDSDNDKCRCRITFCYRSERCRA